jgi:pectate lyase
MYYGKVPGAPLRDRMVMFLALLVASCGGDLNPIRARPATGGDAAVGSDSSIPQVCPYGLIGFATMSDLGGEPDGGTDAAPMLILAGGVSGGGASTPVVIDDAEADALDQFKMYASDKMPGPLTIVLKGMLTVPPTPDGGDTGGESIRVSSNKTVVGANANSGLFGGGLAMTRVSNVILRNLVIARPNTEGDIDAIHIEASHQIWVDHCDLSSNNGTGTYDGLIDISDQSDFVTVSWTHYHDHQDSGLIGRSDSSAAAAEDAGKEHVTYDHDLFTNLKTGPRVRFGTVHVLNSYFHTVANYGVAATDGANVRIEASSFRDVSPAGQTDANFGPVTTILDPPATAGYVDLVNNVIDPADGNGPNVVPSTQIVPLLPPYPYTDALDSAASVPALVTNCAGTGDSVPIPN